MKNLQSILLNLFIFVGIAISCKENERIDPLIGTWTVISETNTNCTQTSDNHVLTIVCNASDCIKLTFKQDGKISVEKKEAGITNIQTGTYSKSGDSITIYIPGDFQDPGTYKISANTLTVVVKESATGCTKTLVLTK